jgi:RHS repeat-associated protein
MLQPCEIIGCWSQGEIGGSRTDLARVLDVENDSVGHLDDTSTYWNAAGQITAQNDVQDDGSNTDLQCYTYDGQGRLTAAWTDTAGVSSAASPSVPNIGGCKSAAPSAATNGGPAPYWETYAYDPGGESSGNRSTVTDYNTSGTVTSQQTYGYTGATGTGGQPDTLQTLSTTNGAGTTLSSAAYTYNPDGSTATDTVTNGSGTPTSTQAYTYDPNGLTSTVTDSTANTKAGYQYDASGNLLLQKDTIAGATTTLLYLPDEQLTMNSSGGITALRYYDTGSGLTVIRDNTGNLTYQASTSQGTGTLTISSALTNENRRYFTPYGNTRGTAPMTWVDGRSYLNQPNDPATGLGLLGAREYDPATGHFLTRDPVLEATDPNQLGGYTYSGDDPVNGTDPNGLAQIRIGPPGTVYGGGGGGSNNGPTTGGGGAGNNGGYRNGTGDGGATGDTQATDPTWVHARTIEHLAEMFQYCTSLSCRVADQAALAQSEATATPMVNLLVAIDNVAANAPDPYPLKNSPPHRSRHALSYQLQNRWMWPCTWQRFGVAEITSNRGKLARGRQYGGRCVVALLHGRRAGNGRDSWCRSGGCGAGGSLRICFDRYQYFGWRGIWPRWGRT